MKRWSSAVLFLGLALSVGASGCEIQTSARYSSSGFMSSSSSSSSSKRGGDDEDERPRAAQNTKKTKTSHKSGGDSGGKKKESASASALADLDHNELVVVAIKDLMGEGNKVEVVQPDKTEAPQKKAVFKLSYEDQVFLVQKLYNPIMADKDKFRALKKAECAYILNKQHIKWDKSVGEAIDDGKCKPEVESRHIYTHPMLKAAFAELLLEGHPKKTELLNQMRLFVAKTVGGEVHSICYRTKQTPEPTPAADASCTEAWANRDWDGYKWVMNVKTYTYAAKAPDDLRLRQLEEVAFLLEKVDPASPSGPEAKTLLEKVKGLTPAAKTKRDQNLQKLRAKNPGIMSVKDLDENPDNYLYHKSCGQPTVESSFENNRLITATYQCVTIAREDDEGCSEHDYMFRKIRGSSQYEWHGSAVGGGQQITCP